MRRSSETATWLVTRILRSVELSDAVAHLPPQRVGQRYPRGLKRGEQRKEHSRRPSDGEGKEEYPIVEVEGNEAPHAATVGGSIATKKYTPTRRSAPARATPVSPARMAMSSPS